MTVETATSLSEPGWQRFLGRGAVLSVLIVGLLPNLFFLAVMPVFIAERLISPLLYVAAALAALFLPRFAVYVLFLAVALIDLGLIVMVAFHLPLALALDSVRYMATIDIAASGFYVAVVCINIGLALLAAWLFDRNRDEIRLASPLPVLLVALALMAADFHFNLRYVTKTVPEFDSALSQNGLSADAIAARGRNLRVVMVEGLGAFADPAERQVLAGRLEKAASAADYTLTNGTTRFSGSTTGAASRELCGAGGIIATTSPASRRKAACRGFCARAVSRRSPITVIRLTCSSGTSGIPRSAFRS